MPQTNLTDAEWGCLEPHLPHPRSHRASSDLYPLRKILDAVFFFYVLKSGCP